MAHTPTPWQPGRHGDLVGANGKKVVLYGLNVSHSMTGSEQEYRDNAAFIVRAVNAHDEMLEALKDTNDLLIAVFGGAADPDDPRHWSDKDAYSRYRRNREVLAKAEGRE